MGSPSPDHFFEFGNKCFNINSIRFFRPHQKNVFNNKAYSFKKGTYSFNKEAYSFREETYAFNGKLK